MDMKYLQAMLDENDYMKLFLWIPTVENFSASC